MQRSLFALPLVSLLLSTAAHAGEDPLYAQTPAWVDEAEISELLADKSAPAELLRDWQYRLEDGVVHAYTDFAVRIDNPQALMNQNTQSLTWLPDKGDITVHRLEIHREGEVIDLVADGVTFDVLRREQGLEYRLLDGQLTATVSVPGLREGDVLRIAHSVTTDDQALGDEVQALQFLPSAPWQVGQARTVVSWPADEEMFWAAEDRADLGEPVERGGYRYLSVDLPLAEADPIPHDAPFRYRRPPVLRVGTFESWEELSRVMVPHFEAAAVLDAGSEIAQQAAAIMARTDNPLQRAAYATQLVQDEVSYLLNGLDGGNYLPQSAEETWDIRYGDCKAKSVLLLSLLREMGIQSEVVLVSTTMGDAAPELLPLPATFNHMIVHAEINGVDYWLDGTSSATRLSTIADVPPFHYALPLREGGTGLVPMVQRDLATPQMTVEMAFDNSAGVDFPSLFTLDMQIVGASGAQMQAVVDSNDPEMLRQMAQGFSSRDEMQVSNLTVDYDPEMAVATIQVQGIAPSSFEWDNGRLRSDLDSNASGIQFNPDRARSTWREIPVQTAGPSRSASIMSMILPQGGEGFAFEGDTDFEGGFANTRVTRQVVLQGDTLRTVSEQFAMLGEIPAAELPEAKRAARRLASESLELLPPEDIVWRWELSEAERRERAAPILAAYEDAIAFADEDDHSPRMYRAWLLTRLYDFEAALVDYDFLVEEETSNWSLLQRASLREMLGDLAGSEADRQAAFDLDPSNANAQQLAYIMGRQGRFDEAIELMESMPVSDDARPAHVGNLAYLYADSGNVAAGQDILLDLVADEPGNAAALNFDCWYRGGYSSELDTAMEVCTRAVERAEFQAGAIDSRALIHFRQGRYDEAIADLDAALELQPELAASYYLRGIVRLTAGDEGGRSDIETGLLMDPTLGPRYERYGLTPPS